MKRGDLKRKESLILCQDGSPFIPYYPGGINVEKCNGCGECVKVCPQNCIEIKEIKGKKVAVIVDMVSCIGDGMCRLVCPEDAFL